MNYGLLVLMLFGPALTFLLVKNDPDAVDYVGFFLLPGLNYVLAAAVLYEVIERSIKSKGTCAIRHDWKETHRSRADHPGLRLRMGGIDSFECTKCDLKRNVKWSAFEMTLEERNQTIVKALRCLADALETTDTWFYLTGDDRHDVAQTIKILNRTMYETFRVEHIDEEDSYKFRYETQEGPE